METAPKNISLILIHTTSLTFYKELSSDCCVNLVILLTPSLAELKLQYVGGLAPLLLPVVVWRIVEVKW